MTPTRWRLLAIIAFVAAVLGWAAAQLFSRVIGAFLPITWTAAGAIWLVAICVLIWTLVARPKLQRLPGNPPLPPIVAARTAALALACSRTGAAIAGGYLGIAVFYFPRAGTVAGLELTWASVVSAVGGVVLALVALWLESLCRIDDGDDDGLSSPLSGEQAADGS